MPTTNLLIEYIQIHRYHKDENRISLSYIRCFIDCCSVQSHIPFPIPLWDFLALLLWLKETEGKTRPYAQHMSSHRSRAQFTVKHALKKLKSTHSVSTVRDHYMEGERASSFLPTTYSPAKRQQGDSMEWEKRSQKPLCWPFHRQKWGERKTRRFFHLSQCWMEKHFLKRVPRIYSWLQVWVVCSWSSISSVTRSVREMDACLLPHITLFGKEGTAPGFKELFLDWPACV